MCANLGGVCAGFAQAPRASFFRSRKHGGQAWRYTKMPPQKRLDSCLMKYSLNGSPHPQFDPAEMPPNTAESFQPLAESLSVVFPAFNEQYNIRNTVVNARRILPGI